MTGLRNPHTRTPLLRSLVLVLGCVALGAGSLLGSGCVDPDGEFEKFDRRVYDAGAPPVGTGCLTMEIPEVSGEFFLNLSTPLSRDSFLQFIFTQSINKNVNPALLSMSLQPLCVQEAQCEVGQPFGDMVTLDNTTVDENCDFELLIEGVEIPGGANAISGSDLIGNLDMKGNLQTTDFYCGIVDGSAIVGGAEIPINGSTFGSVRNSAVGALGDDLPDPIAICPVVP
jgi:hypothetical protein